MEPTDTKLANLEKVQGTGVDLEAREVYVTGEIDTDAAYLAMTALRQLDKSDGRIRIIVNSPGGDPYSAMALYDMIKGARNEVVTHGYGQVMSAATLLLQAGRRRLLSPFCRFMIHEGTWHLGESHLSVVKAAGREAEACAGIYNRLFAERGGKLSAEQVARLSEKETYMSAQEAVDSGFADEVAQ